MRVPLHNTGLLWSAFNIATRAGNVTVTNSTCAAGNAIAADCQSNETPHYRDFFYVGGHDVLNADIGGNLTYDQIYVEKLRGKVESCRRSDSTEADRIFPRWR